MPILSNLSKRFHMLTTDAKPEPPRIPIKGYTHNLAEEEKTRDTKSESGSVAPEGSNVTSSERNKSLLNDAVPIANANYSAARDDFRDTQTPVNEDKQPRKSNIGTRTKSKQRKYPQGTRVVNYNIINSNGVKIGSRTSYICNINQAASNTGETSDGTWSKSKNRQMPLDVENLSACTDEITLDDIFILKTYIGHGWKDVARKLLYSDGQIDQFEENYRFRGIGEVIYQIFLDWKQANTKDAEIGNVISILWACKEYDCAEKLSSARKNSM